MVFSTEVCSTFTAMSSRTLLSDHVCAEQYSYRGTLTFQKKTHTRARARTYTQTHARAHTYTKSLCPCLCATNYYTALSLLTRVPLGNLAVAVLSKTLPTVYRLERFTSVTNFKLFTPVDTTLKQFLQNHHHHHHRIICLSWS